MRGRRGTFRTFIDVRGSSATNWVGMDAAAFDLAGVASDEHEVTRRLLRQREKFAFHHSFGRPTGTKRREGCFGNVKNLHFTTVLGVPRARSDETVASAT